MTRNIAEHFRKRRAEKRGGALPVASLDGDIPVEARSDVLLAVDEALTRLSALDKRLGTVVECKFFGGMTQEQIAAALDLSERTVRGDWLKAKAWLARELRQGGDDRGVS